MVKSSTISSNLLVKFEQTLKKEIINDFIKIFIELQSDTDYKSLVIDEQNSKLRDILEKHIMTPSSSSKCSDKPKRVSGYNLFVRSNLPKLKNQHSKHSDAMIEIGRKWKALADDEKQVYISKAKDLKNDSKNDSIMLSAFERYFTGKIYHDERAVDVISNETSCELAYKTVNTKYLYFYEYYESLHVEIDNNVKYYICETDEYWKGFYTLLKEYLGSFKYLETMHMETRFISEIDWSFLVTKPLHLKNLHLQMLANLTPEFTDGLELLEITDGEEEMEHPTIIEECGIFGKREPYKNIKKIKIRTPMITPKNAHKFDYKSHSNEFHNKYYYKNIEEFYEKYVFTEKDMDVLQKRFPDSQLVFVNGIDDI